MPKRLEMKKSKFAETQIVGILKMADAGMPVKNICSKAGISEPTYYLQRERLVALLISALKGNA